MEIFIEELRRARNNLGFSQEQLAELISYSQSMVAMVESGNRTPSRAFADKADTALQTDGLLGRLLDFCLRQERTPQWFRPWLEIERQATSLRTYQPNLVPGLLQTEDYARAILGDETRVQTRMERQRAAQAIKDYVAVIDESVLTRPIGGAAVMAEQIDRLISDHRAVVHVVPASTGYYTGLDGAFTIAHVDGVEVAVMDNLLRGQVVELPDDLAFIRRAWETVRSEALPRGQSLALMREVRDRCLTLSGASPAAATGKEATA